jgi:serine/threonine protein kinase
MNALDPDRLEYPAESWDLWVLAVVTYDMLTGAHPFAGSTAIEVHNAVLAGRVTPLRTHLPDATRSWQHFFDRAFTAQVETRPASALQLFSAFKQSIQ